MLTLSLHPAEFAAMVAFLSRISRDNIDLPLSQQPLTICVLLAFQAKLRLEQLFAWGQRDKHRSYKYRLPITVARALHQEMQHYLISSDQQAFLKIIDLAIINYRVPLLKRYTLNSTLVWAVLSMTALYRFNSFSYIALKT